MGPWRYDIMTPYMDIEARYTIPPGATNVPDWFITARYNQKNGSTHTHHIEDTLIQRVIGEGVEQIAYLVTKGQDTFVLKETKPTLPLRYKILAWLGIGIGYDNFLTWIEISEIRQRDYSFLRDLLPENILETEFSHCYSLMDPDKQTNVAIQKLVLGREMQELSRTELQALFEYESFRAQMLEIIWTIKRTYIEFGATPDFHLGNIIVTQDRLLIIDTGLPSFFGGIAHSNCVPLIKKWVLEDMGLNQLKEIEEIESILEPTSEEIARLNEKYEITSKKYETQKAWARLELANITLGKILKQTLTMQASLLIRGLKISAQLNYH